MKGKFPITKRPGKVLFKLCLSKLCLFKCHESSESSGSLEIAPFLSTCFFS